jgi:hypothetical protein
LSLIFNESYNSGILPIEWKLSTIVPVFKKGSKSNPSNYRPINLTSPIARLMEKMISEAIRESYKFYFDNNQFGFLRGRSCVQSILYSQSLWEKALKTKSPVDVVYFDFKKAFDKINHTLLLVKLEQIGLDEKLQKWFRSFLSNRSCVVKVGNSISNREIAMHSGVPQGTVTGPLLFLLFINDIFQCIPPTVGFALFADDLKIFGSDSMSLQLAIDNVNDWSQKWDLPLANTKINALYLGANNPRVQYIIDNCLIKSSAVVKDLGIYIDERLTFENHIDRKVAIANHRCAAILRAFRFQNPEQFFRVYNIYVRPILDYGSAVYFPKTRSSLISTLEKPLRSFTRNVFQRFGLPYNSYQDRLRQFDLHSHRYGHIISDLLLCYKMIFSISHFPYYPFELCSSRRYNLRLRVPLDIYKNDNFFLRRIVPTWNNLVPFIQNVPDLNSFKMLLKSFDLSRLNVECIEFLP